MDEQQKGKQFNMIVSLVKTQIHAQKRIRKNGVEKCNGALQLLMDKYDWIASPGFSPAEQKPAPLYAPGTPNRPMSRVRGQREAAPAPKSVPRPPPQLPSAAPQGAPARPVVLPEGWEQEEDNRVPCPYCARKFAPDRVEKHQTVCPQQPGRKKAAEKRGALDMTAKRVQAVRGSG